MLLHIFFVIIYQFNGLNSMVSVKCHQEVIWAGFEGKIIIYLERTEPEAQVAEVKREH